MSLDNTPVQGVEGLITERSLQASAHTLGSPSESQAPLFLQVAENNFVYQDLYRSHWFS